jgi:hypothetical protein
MASSAAAMKQEELEQEVIKLRTQLKLVASQQKNRLKRTKAANKDLHDKVLQDTADIVEKINSIDMYSLWRVEQTLNERKTHLNFKHASLVSYKNYVWRSGAKQAAGMRMTVTPNRTWTSRSRA